MLLSEKLFEIGIQCKCINESPFSSLGLVGYNDGSDVCTFLADPKFARGLSDDISMILTSHTIYHELCAMERVNGDYGICLVDDPRLVYFQLHNALCRDPEYKRPEFNTVVSEGAQISHLAYVANRNVIIGKNVIIEEFVSIKENTVIGDNCVIRAGTKIGGTGFEIKKTDDKLITVDHIGGVVIGENVEIQQNTNIDKAIYPWDNTEISDNTRINSLVQIAHGTKIGRFTEIVAGASIQGRVKIGENVWIGPNSVIRNGISVGNYARINMGAAVTLDVPEGKAVSGNFARNHTDFIGEMRKYKK